MTEHAATGDRRAARIMIVDDHQIVREGLGIRIARQADLMICGEAASVAEALAQVEATAPDVAIIDISLGKGDGIDLIRRLRRSVAYGLTFPLSGPAARCRPSARRYRAGMAKAFMTDRKAAPSRYMSMKISPRAPSSYSPVRR